MKNALKKGFTIVELVIVIAVIAILAAVLIPTFSSVTNSAKESAAMQQAKSGSEVVLALTTGTLPENSAFLVAEKENGETKYTYKFANRSLSNDDKFKVNEKCLRHDLQGGFADGYIVYVSTDALKTDDEGQVLTNSQELNQAVAKRIAEATNAGADTVNAAVPVTIKDDYGYFTIGSIHYNLYWTSDFRSTLIAFMGDGKINSDNPAPVANEVTVSIAVKDSAGTQFGTTKTEKHTKGEAVTLTINLSQFAGADATSTTMYSIYIGNSIDTATQTGTAQVNADGTITVELTTEQTANDIAVVLVH